MNKTIKYVNDIDLYDCDCPFPARKQKVHKRLGRSVVIRECCMAAKLSGGMPTANGVPVTDFTDVYEFTHVRKVDGDRERAPLPEYVVADRPWDPDEVQVIADQKTTAESLEHIEALEDAVNVARVKVKNGVRGAVKLLADTEKALTDYEPVVLPKITRKKGAPPAWLDKRLKEKFNG